MRVNEKGVPDPDATQRISVTAHEHPVADGSWTTVVRARAFVLLIQDADKAVDSWVPVQDMGSTWQLFRFTWGRQRITLGYVPILNGRVCPARREWEHSVIRLVLGDDSELGDTWTDQCLGYAVTLTIDCSRRVAEVTTSIVGLPPIFLARFGDSLALASEVRLLLQHPSVTAELDPDAVSDIFRIGYPLYGRTMFRQVSMLPAGQRLRVDTDCRTRLEQCWVLPECDRVLTWRDAVAVQVETFRRAVRALNVEESFLSLTGGLDTRAILAALIADGRTMPACTLTGPVQSIDSRIARALCSHYGLQHIDVVLDGEFLRELPSYVLEASRLSGGISGIGQAHELYFYRQVAHLGLRRLSGNLGNQVGHSGTEGTSLRGADLTVLAPGFDRRELPALCWHWLDDAVREAGGNLLSVLLQQEAPFAMVANHCIGQSFAIQLSPYAKRGLIEDIVRASYQSAGRDFSQFAARVRDLQHRFLGPSRRRSFQCLVIAEAGGYVARKAINWGWRVDGFPEPSSLLLGGCGLLDAIAHSSMPFARLAMSLSQCFGLCGIQEFRQPKSWLDIYLNNFARDLFSSASVRESGVFDHRRLTALVEQHFSGRHRHYGTMTAALDVATAIAVFGARAC